MYYETKWIWYLRICDLLHIISSYCIDHGGIGAVILLHPNVEVSAHHEVMWQGVQGVQEVLLSEEIWDYNVHSEDCLIKAYDVTIQRYRKSHTKIKVSKMYILQCMGSKCCAKFQRWPAYDISRKSLNLA